MEVWKGIEDYPFYEVSNLGRVRSLDKWVKYSDGRKDRLFKGQILKIYNLKKYPTVGLSSGRPRKIRSKRVHTLVAKAFIDKDYNKKGLVVNHIDGNKLNNRLDNIEVVTHKYNLQHALDTGLRKQKSRLFNAAEVKDIEASYAELKNYCAVARIYDCNPETISSIIKKKYAYDTSRNESTT